MARTTKPKPSADLTGEALAEWERISSELKKLGRLNTADRAVMLLYCQTYATWRAAAVAVQQHGAVVEHENHVRGQSHDYKVMRETSKILKDLLSELGLTPKSRADQKAKQQKPGKLNY